MEYMENTAIILLYTSPNATTAVCEVSVISG